MGSSRRFSPDALIPPISEFYHRHALEETTSTNEIAHELAGRGAPEGTLVTARRQTRGRGRRGNTWSSPPGNLYLSLVLRPQVSAQRAAQLSFVTALAVGQLVRSRTSEETVALKWPNDVMVRNRKVSGILLEAGPLSERRPSWIVVGIGINVREAPRTSQNVTALAALGDPEPDPESALSDFRRLFHDEYDRWVRHGFEPVREAWLRWAYRRGQTVRINLRNETFEAIFDGIDETGALLATLPDGKITTVSGGEVHFDLPEP
jgi:BirA family biotin operon repressor/biotin-[acetyl-CoA-carboxylase] ligase